MPTDPLAEFLVSHAQAIIRVHRRGNADGFGLTPADLGMALHRSARAWNAEAQPAAIGEYLDTLRADDFVLAVACTHGNERAWEGFIEKYRPVLYGAAHALTHDKAGARELADSLWADLYGIDPRTAERRSLLGYYGGRSSLGTWLHAVLARRFIDSTRAAARTTPLESRPHEPATEGDPPDPDRSRYVSALGTALSEALTALEPRDRLRLGYYYLENLTLREIARLLDEHPSSVSRRLQQTRSELKRRVERWLRREQHLSEEQIRLCYAYAAEQSPFDLGRALSESK
ncbi:MAG TPA: sigma-70 family RNA polymerase sigma factor [Candidatus Binataceae bacterium]|nr:sigma-70 family RNA polymerase sigma factor [Candidatus Binataceae bacterium]